MAFKPSARATSIAHMIFPAPVFPATVFPAWVFPVPAFPVPAFPAPVFPAWVFPGLALPARTSHQGAGPPSAADARIRCACRCS